MYFEDMKIAGSLFAFALGAISKVVPKKTSWV